MQIPMYCKVEGTNDEMVRFVAWVFDVLDSGIMPKVGYYNEDIPGGGRKICGGLRFALSGLKSDMAEKQEQHKYSRWWKKNFICELDLACKTGPNSYSDFRECAKWASTRAGLIDYMLHACRRELL